MRRVFLSIITISQLFGALLAFAYLDAALKQMPLSAATPPQKLVLIGTMVIFLLGLVGSILIWLGRRAGIWLSLAHELLIVPVFIIPGVFFWVLGDALSFAVVVWQSGSVVSYSVVFNFGTRTLLQVLNPMPGTSYYGANVFALICVLYLSRLIRRGAVLAGVGG